MNKKNFKVISMLFYQTIDLLVIAFAIMAAYKIYRLSGLGHSVIYQKIDIIPVSVVVAFATVVILQGFGAYRLQSSVLNVEEIRSVLKGVTASFVIFTILEAFGRFAISRYVVLFSYIFSLVSLVALKTIFYHIPMMGLTKIYRKYQRRILIYGAGELGKTLYKELANSPKLNITPVGFIDDDPQRQGEIAYASGVNVGNGLRVLGTRNDIKRLMEELDIDEVYVAMSNIPRASLIKILNYLRRGNVKFHFVPSLYNVFIHKLDISQIGQIPLVYETSFHEANIYAYMKPYLDFLLAVISLIATFPLFLMIAAAIKMDSRGPVFFTQDRVGKDGKVFKFYKFRSMHQDVDPYAVNPLNRNDSRITRVGRILRRTSLDELPQLINVLKGEMSLVGPRPEMPFIVAEYNETQKERLAVLPGITGLWQLSGDRNKAIHENMDYDLYYIRNVSLSLDLAILIETVIFAFRGI